MTEAIRICRERFSDPDLNVNRLADELAMDRSTLRRIFQSKMRMTPSDYLAKLRIQHALSLLDQTRWRRSLIAPDFPMSATSAG